MAELLIQPKLDSSQLADQLKKAEVDYNKLSKESFDRDRASTQVLQQKLQLETRINGLYQQRLNLINQINSKETGMFGRLKAQGQLMGNTAQMIPAVGAYGSMSQGGISTVGMIGADVVGTAVGLGVGLGKPPLKSMTAQEWSKQLPKGVYGISGDMGSGLVDLKTQLKYALPSIKSGNYKSGLEELTFGTANNVYQRLFGKTFSTGNTPRDLMTGETSADIMTSGGWFRRNFRSLGRMPKLLTGLSAGTLGYKAFNMAQEAYEGGQNLQISSGDYVKYAQSTQRSGMGSIEDIYGKYQAARGRALGGDLGAIRSFGQYGMKTSDLSNTQQGFDKLMSSISKTTQTVYTARAATDIFGESANKVVSGIGKFNEIMKSVSTTMSSETIQQLVTMKDTFSTTMKEIVVGLGTILSPLSFFASGLNQLKAQLAGIATMVGEWSIGNFKGSYAKGNQAYIEALNAYTPMKPQTPKVDVTTVGQVQYFPTMDHHIRMNRLQSMGLFQSTPLQQLNPIGKDLHVIAVATEKTAKNTEGLGG